MGFTRASIADLQSRPICSCSVALLSRPDAGLWLISFSGVECLQLNTVGFGMWFCYDHAYLRQGTGLN